MTTPPPPLTREDAEERLRDWALDHGWQIVFPNDALPPQAKPGVVDAVLMRADPRQPDRLQMQLLKIRIGGGQPAQVQVRRLHESLERIAAKTLYACFEADDLHFVETDGWL